MPWGVLCTAVFAVGSKWAHCMFAIDSKMGTLRGICYRQYNGHAAVYLLQTVKCHGACYVHLWLLWAHCVFATDSKMPLVALCTSVFAVGSDWAHCEWARKMMAEMGKVMADMDYRNLERKMFLCKVRSASPHCFVVNPCPDWHLLCLLSRTSKLQLVLRPVKQVRLYQGNIQSRV